MAESNYTTQLVLLSSVFATLCDYNTSNWLRRQLFSDVRLVITEAVQHELTA